MLYVNTNFAIDPSVSKITWMIERQSYENTLSLVKSAWIWTIQRKFVFTLIYWFKSRTWQSKSNRACAKGTWKPGNKKHGGRDDVVRELKERLFSALIRVFQRIWSMQEVNLSWERKCWTTLKSKLRRKTCCGRSCWTLAHRYGKLIELKTSWTHQDHAIA